MILILFCKDSVFVDYLNKIISRTPHLKYSVLLFGSQNHIYLLRAAIVHLQVFRVVLSVAYLILAHECSDMMPHLRLLVSNLLKTADAIFNMPILVVINSRSHVFSVVRIPMMIAVNFNTSNYLTSLSNMLRWLGGGW